MSDRYRDHSCRLRSSSYNPTARLPPVSAGAREVTNHLSRSLPVLVMAVVTSVWSLRAADLPNDTWPDSWFHPPEQASEAGITRFFESPMLAVKVAAGTLPPLEQRLPHDPFVIVPADEIGRHGGTLRCFGRDDSVVRSLEPPLIMDPQVSGILPNLAESWHYSEGGPEVV